MAQAKKRILISEDEGPLLQVLGEKFTNEGFVVFKAKDGIEAVDMALREHPDLILLDVIMPRMDGIMALQKIREDSWGQGVPVIILTNLNDADTAGEALKNRAYDYMVKSDWKLDDVVKKVRERLEDL